jgi:predicted 3-demethylubiquinone-9 3-methyltransferase (glyoxalase superfamily)
MIDCKDQAEVDYYWNRFVGDGGEESMCGWCKDKFGFSWQVVPKGIDQFWADHDEAAVNRALEAMFQMKKLDVAALNAAAEGVTA